MNEDEKEKLIKTLKSFNSVGGTGQLNSIEYTLSLAARVGSVLAFILLVCGVLYWIVSHDKEKNEVKPSLSTSQVKAILDNSTPLELESNRYKAVLEIEQAKNELVRLRHDYNLKKSEITELDKEITEKKNQLKSNATFRKEFKDELEQKAIDHIEAESEETRAEGYEEGYHRGNNNGHGQGIVDAALLYYLFN